MYVMDANRVIICPCKFSLLTLSPRNFASSSAGGRKNAPGSSYHVCPLLLTGINQEWKNGKCCQNLVEIPNTKQHENSSRKLLDRHSTATNINSTLAAFRCDRSKSSYVTYSRRLQHAGSISWQTSSFRAGHKFPAFCNNPMSITVNM